MPSPATRAGRRNSEAKRGIQRETQTHENDVRRVKSPTKKGLANHDQGQKKAYWVMFRARRWASPIAWEIAQY